MQTRLFRVAAWLISLLLLVVLSGVIGWTLRSQPETLALPTPIAFVTSAPASPTSAPASPTSAPAPTLTATIAPKATAALTPPATATATLSATPSATIMATATSATATPAFTATEDTPATATVTDTVTDTPVITFTPALPVTPVFTDTAAATATPAATVASSITISTVEIVGLPVPTPTPPLDNGDWGSLTDPNQMQELVVISNTVWIASSGGALAWSKGSNTPVLYTAADGLYGNQLNTVVNCALSGFGIVFGSPAGLQIGDARTGRWRQINSGSGSGMRYDDVSTVYCDAQNDFLIIGYREHGIDIYDAASDEWQHMDRNSGLAANDARALAVVGNREQIWVASNDGVTVAAGADSTFYNADNSELADNRVEALAAAADGAVWLGGKGVMYRVQAKQWSVYDEGSVEGDFPTQQITAMAFAPDGALWLASADAEVCRFDIKQERCSDFYAGAAGMAPGPLTSLTVDANGNVYYTTDGNGYAVFDGRTWRSLAVRDPLLVGNSIKALALDASGALWAATEAGVQQLAENKLPTLFDGADSGIAALDIRTLHPGADGGMWVGGMQGASFFDGSSWQAFTTKEGLAGDTVQAITVDGEGRTWFGTNRGLSVWNGSSFFTIDKERGLPSEDIRALAAGDGAVWIGTAGGGLYRFAGNQLQLFNRQNIGLPSDNITALASGADGELWVGTYRGLARLAGGDLLVIQELDERPITALAATAAEEVWAAAAEDGVFYSDGARWIQLTLGDKLPSASIAALLAQGTQVWIGGQEGGITHFQR